MDRLFEFTVVNNCVNVDYRYNLGHRFGECLVSPDGQFRLIYIPKNASIEVRNALNGWKKSNYLEDKHQAQNIVLFRDPTERWISGIAEFLVGKFSYMGNINQPVDVDELDYLMTSNLFQNLLFHFGIFDGHTLPQACYVNGIDLSHSLFFFIDHEVMSKISKYLAMPMVSIYNNKSESNAIKYLIIKKLQKIISERPDFQKMIDIHYYADHQLCERARFY